MFSVNRITIRRSSSTLDTLRQVQLRYPPPCRNVHLGPARAAPALGTRSYSHWSEEIDVDDGLVNDKAPSGRQTSGTPQPVKPLPTPSNTSTTFPPLSETPGSAAIGSGDQVLPFDWSKSFHGLSIEPFASEVAEILQAPVNEGDIEIKPDGLLYLPEIKYRRILNKAFGPGGWGLAPRSDTNVGPKIVSREYALICLGRLVAIARGEQEYFDPNGIPTATEACKSNALMRCCKDLGVASELWDPRFIRQYKAKNCVEAFVEHIPTKKKRKLWRRKDDKFDYPYKE